MKVTPFQISAKKHHWSIHIIGFRSPEPDPFDPYINYFAVAHIYHLKGQGTLYQALLKILCRKGIIGHKLSHEKIVLAFLFRIYKLFVKAHQDIVKNLLKFRKEL